MIYTYIRVVSHVYTYRPTRTLALAYAYIRISLCERTYNSAHNILGFLTANLSDTQHNQPRYSE